jgi:hypothetical protein
VSERTVTHPFLYERDFKPFRKSWENWAISWYEWMISIPKMENPCLDMTGGQCAINQTNKNVWFLAGSFGNKTLIRRQCNIPVGKAILFPLFVKEDSFAEDLDLTGENELTRRAKEAIDRTIYMKATLDGKKLSHLERYRVRSQVFDLRFPKDNVYDVKPGLTRSVCDGYWLFMKPLEEGRHTIYFTGECLLGDSYTRKGMAKKDVYSAIREQIEKSRTFNLEVQYDILITPLTK